MEAIERAEGERGRLDATVVEGKPGLILKIFAPWDLEESAFLSMALKGVEEQSCSAGLDFAAHFFTNQREIHFNPMQKTDGWNRGLSAEKGAKVGRVRLRGVELDECRSIPVIRGGHYETSLYPVFAEFVPSRLGSRCRATVTNRFGESTKLLRECGLVLAIRRTGVRG